LIETSARRGSSSLELAKTNEVQQDQLRREQMGQLREGKQQLESEILVKSVNKFKNEVDGDTMNRQHD